MVLQFFQLSAQEFGDQGIRITWKIQKFFRQGQVRNSLIPAPKLSGLISTTINQVKTMSEGPLYAGTFTATNADARNEVIAAP